MTDDPLFADIPPLRPPAPVKPMEFFIEGKPFPGGSKTAFVPRRKDGSFVMRPGTSQPVINITDAAGKNNKLWKKACAVFGKNFMRGARPFEQPIKVEFIFFMRRPDKHWSKRKGQAGVLLPDAPQYHTGPPDAIKLARSTEDALTGICWKDDSISVRVCTEKRWCGADDRPGCIVRIVPLF